MTLVYHGTRGNAVGSIRDRGILPSNDGAVYLTEDRDCAVHFACVMADYYGDHPVVIVIDLPDNAQVKPLAMGPWSAIEHQGRIPADWIVEVEES